MTDESAEQVFVDTAGHIPANTGNTISDPITKGFSDAVATGFPRPQIKQLDNFWGNFGNAQQLILETGADPVTAIADACAAMDTGERPLVRPDIATGGCVVGAPSRLSSPTTASETQPR